MRDQANNNGRKRTFWHHLSLKTFLDLSFWFHPDFFVALCFVMRLCLDNCCGGFHGSSKGGGIFLPVFEMIIKRIMIICRCWCEVSILGGVVMKINLWSPNHNIRNHMANCFDKVIYSNYLIYVIVPYWIMWYTTLLV